MFFVIVVSKIHLGDIIMALSDVMVFIPFVEKRHCRFVASTLLCFLLLSSPKDSLAIITETYNGVILRNDVYLYPSYLDRITVLCLPFLSPVSLVFSLERIKTKR